jgi:hypothetical protein
MFCQPCAPQLHFVLGTCEQALADVQRAIGADRGSMPITSSGYHLLKR